MTLRKLLAVAPVIGALAVAAPVATASAQTTSAPASPTSAIPCYPYPAFCGPNGQPWFQVAPLQLPTPALPTFTPLPIQLPGIQIP